MHSFICDFSNDFHIVLSLEFSSEELAIATNYFSKRNELGKGGYGNVTELMIYDVRELMLLSKY